MEAETVVDAAASLLEADVVALAVADVAATLTLALPRQCSPWEALCMLLRARCSASQPMPSTSHTLTPPSSTFLRHCCSLQLVLKDARSAFREILVLRVSSC